MGLETFHRSSCHPESSNILGFSQPDLTQRRTRSFLHVRVYRLLMQLRSDSMCRSTVWSVKSWLRSRACDKWKFLEERRSLLTWTPPRNWHLLLLGQCEFSTTEGARFFQHHYLRFYGFYDTFFGKKVYILLSPVTFARKNAKHIS